MTRSSKAKMIIGIVIGAAGALIALQNLQPVDTNVFLWRFNMPNVLLRAIMLAAGFVLGVTVSVILRVKFLDE